MCNKKNMDNKVVFTTRFVVEDNSEIIYACHDSDGDWQFFSKEEATEEDAMIISMDEILEIDNSIEKILDIPKGFEAHRSNKLDDWIIASGQ